MELRHLRCFIAVAETPICACSMPFECPVSGAESRPPTGWFGSSTAIERRVARGK
jgi:hypothetical protein